MKTLILFSSLLISCFSLSAAIITVDNSANGGGQYSNLQTAADNAVSGDTLHIIGSNATYGNLVLAKQLTLIGAGYNPPNQLGLPSVLGSISIGNSSGLGSASGSTITGLMFSTLTSSGSAIHNNITIERCEVSNLYLPSNGNSGSWIIQNNIISTIILYNSSNCMIRNNVIKSTISSSDEPSIVITNNNFVSNTINGAAFSSMQFATITNNIFFNGRNPQGCTSCTFNNNLTYNTNNNTLPYGNNTGAGNLVGIDPLFTNVTSGIFDFSFDYRLQGASQAAAAGTDGTDIGIYGGIHSFPIGGPVPYLTSAMPRVPQVLEVNIQNSTIFQGDPLQVQVKARKQD